MTGSPCGSPVASIVQYSPPNTILLSVEVKCDRDSRQEHLGRSLRGDDAVVIMELNVQEAELSGAAV